MDGEKRKKKRNHYIQGVYKLTNPKKYAGDPSKCVYRSGWEKKVFKYFDKDPATISWKVEPFSIQYISPKDNKPHRYFPDIIVATKTKDKGVVVTLIEIKPEAQTKPPVAKQGKKKERLLQEQMTYDVNKAKWDAAREICKQKGWQFKIMTEKHINPNGKAKR